MPSSTSTPYPPISLCVGVLALALCACVVMWRCVVFVCVVADCFEWRFLTAPYVVLLFLPELLLLDPLICFSLPPSRSHRVGMEGRHSVDQPHVEVRPAELRSARLRSAELRVPQLRRPKLQRQLSRRGGGITSVFSMATKPHDAQLRRTL